MRRLPTYKHVDYNALTLDAQMTPHSLSTRTHARAHTMDDLPKNQHQTNAPEACLKAPPRSCKRILEETCEASGKAFEEPREPD